MQHDDLDYSDYSDSNVAWRCVDSGVRGEARTLVFCALVVLGIGLVIWFAR